MAPSDRRRGSTQNAGRPSTPSKTSSIIAAPPKAQLTGPTSSSSSPVPDNEAGHEPGPGQSTAREGSAGLPPKGDLDIILKEKDSRISKLQNELSVMESEFVQELERLSQNENESTNFWRTKHSNLNQQYLRTDTELRLLRAEVDLREAERLEMRDNQESLHRELKDREDEIRSLRGHINGMKQWVSTSTRSDNQVSDEEISEAIAKLGNGLQNWVIMHFRRAKLDITKAEQSIVDDLKDLVPMCGVPNKASKVQMLQSAVSAILVDIIFNSYYVGLPPERAREIQNMEKYLGILGSVEAVNQWRAATLTLLRKEASEKLQNETTEVVDKTTDRICNLLDSITDAKPSDARHQGIRALVANAVELARLLSVQKAVFTVEMPRVMPHQEILFDSSTMEDIGGEDEESLTAREICCVTFPGVLKTGDENGGQPHFRNVITKIKVVCSPE